MYFAITHHIIDTDRRRMITKSFAFHGFIIGIADPPKREYHAKEFHLKKKSYHAISVMNQGFPRNHSRLMLYVFLKSKYKSSTRRYFFPIEKRVQKISIRVLSR